jgi:HSP20 family protein
MSAQVVNQNQDEKNLGTQSGTPAQERKDRVISPRVNVYEKDQEAIFLIEMPGVSENDLEIQLDKGVLTVEGRVEKEQVPDYGKNARVYQESNYTLYRRKFSLGKPVDADRSVASLKNGVLRLTLPKIEPQRKKISIQSQS